MNSKKLTLFATVFALSTVFAEGGLRDFNPEIERVSAAGGGRVTVPAGTWRTGKIHLKSNVELHLEEGATLLFTDDPQAYLPAVLTSWEGVECYNYSPLVYALGATNVAITGKGRLEAEMGTWKAWGGNRKPKAEAAKLRMALEWGPNDVPVAERDLTKIEGSNMRPPFIGLNRCRGIRLEGFSIRNTPFWTIHILQSEDVVLRGLDVSANCINNSDGANFECTRNVLVEDCTFEQGDDVICCKSGLDRDGRRRGLPTENVLVRRCRAKAGHGFMTIGSECSGGVRNATMEDCEIEGECRTLLNVKTRETRGGFIENVTVRRVKARKVTQAVVNVTARNDYWSCYQKGLDQVLTRIDGVTAEDISVDEAERVVSVQGDPGLPVRNLSIRNVTAKKARNPDVIENVRSSDDDSLFLAELRVRDPFVVNAGGERPYHLYMSDNWLDGTPGVSVSTSSDLIHWSKPKNVMKPPAFCWQVWAPEVHRWKDRWYMFVTLKERPGESRPVKTMVPGDPDWKNGLKYGNTYHAVWVFAADDPKGPFLPVSDRPITDPDWISLDGTLAVEDGMPWMVFTHDWAQIKVGTYELAPMSGDLTHFLAPPKTLFSAAVFPMMPDRGVTDGAFVYRSPKSGKLFMIWSTHNPARPKGREYCVILAESASGRLAGPWVNHHPLFDENGGHGMIFRKTDGTPMLCLHCPEEWGHEHPLLLPLVDDGMTLKLADSVR